MSRLGHTRPFPEGLILDVARRAGIDVGGEGDKRRMHCPFHDDRNPSAFLSASRNLFYCSVCTVGKGWSAKRFARELGVAWPLQMPKWGRRRYGARAGVQSLARGAGDHVGTAVIPAASAPTPDTGPFGPGEARRVWKLARHRAYDDDRSAVHYEADRIVYEYLRSRGLEEAWEERCFGILGEDMDLPDAIRWWPRNQYRLVAPLYDERGEVVNVQARLVRSREGAKKVLVPRGSGVTGTMFASRLGRELLRNHRAPHGSVIIGEGLTDHLALCIASLAPVFSTPGAGVGRHIFGSWARGRAVWVALDADEAGERSLHPVARAAYESGAVSVRRIVWPRGCKDACDALGRLGSVKFACLLSGLLREPTAGTER